MKTKETPKKPKSGYWYKFYYWGCLLCSDYYEYKERMYTPKPKDYADRHDYYESVCAGHYL